MIDLYLSEQKKIYYAQDFTENVLTETDDFWKVNEAIVEYLKLLNECKKIQPLYSMFPTKGSLPRDTSYLIIAYTKDIELSLYENILPYHSTIYDNDSSSKFSFHFVKGNENAQFSDRETKYKMGCIINRDFFRINKLKINFENFNREKHKFFWEKLTNELVSLK